MDEKPDEQEPDPQGNPKEPEKLNGGKGISRVSLALLFGGFSAFLAAWAGLLGNLGHTYWIFAATVMLVAGACLALGLRIELRNHHWRKWQYNGAACALAVLAFSLGIPVIVKEFCRREARPHLTLYLRTSASPNAVLMFTNDFLFMKIPQRKVPEVPKWAGFLVVRVPPGKTNVALRFGLLNDSASRYEIVDDSALAVDVSYLDLIMTESVPNGRLKWTADPMWKQRNPTRLHFQLPPLLPGIGESTPEIVFDRSEEFPEAMTISAEIRGKRVPAIAHIFHLVFIRSNSVIDPYFDPNDITALRLKLGPMIESAVTQSIATLKGQDNPTSYLATHWPGFVFNNLICLGQPKIGRDNYIFDVGQSLEKNRMSLYIDTENNWFIRKVCT